MTIITRLDVFLCLFHRMKNYLLNVTAWGSYTKNEITLRILEGTHRVVFSRWPQNIGGKSGTEKGTALEGKLLKREPRGNPG